MISKWLPTEERSRYSSIIWAGAQFGTMLAMPISGLLADEVGWESVFYFFGTLGAIWFLFWSFLCFSYPTTHPSISEVSQFCLSFGIFCTLFKKHINFFCHQIKFLNLFLNRMLFAFLQIFCHNVVRCV